MSDSAKRWAKHYVETASTAAELGWPSETLVRLFRGDYVPHMPRDFSGRRVLEVGFGNGNNTRFLATLGLAIAGTEIHDDICATIGSQLRAAGLEADLRVGTNRALPFESDRFDFLVSWNVLHYEGTEEGIRAGLREYARVLKPGGRLFLSTTGPEHKILNGAETLGGHRYRIGRRDDFRAGEVHFFFDAPNYVHHYFTETFGDVMVGRTHDHLFTATLDWWIVTAVKR